MKKKSIKKSLKKTTIKGGEEPYISAIIGNPPGKFVPDNIIEEVDLGHREAIIKKYEDKKKTADEKYRILNENYKDEEKNLENKRDRFFRWFVARMPIFYQMYQTIKDIIIGLKVLAVTFITFLAKVLVDFKGAVFGFFKSITESRGAVVRALIFLFFLALIIYGIVMLTVNKKDISNKAFLDKITSQAFIQSVSNSPFSVLSEQLYLLIPDDLKQRFTSLRNSISKFFGNDIQASSINTQPREVLKTGRHDGIIHIKKNDINDTQIYTVVKPDNLTWTLNIDSYSGDANIDYFKLPTNLRENHFSKTLFDSSIQITSNSKGLYYYKLDDIEYNSITYYNIIYSNYIKNRYEYNKDILEKYKASIPTLSDNTEQYVFINGFNNINNNNLIETIDTTNLNLTQKSSLIKALKLFIKDVIRILKDDYANKDIYNNIVRKYKENSDNTNFFHTKYNEYNSKNKAEKDNFLKTEIIEKKFTESDYKGKEKDYNKEFINFMENLESLKPKVVPINIFSKDETNNMFYKLNKIPIDNFLFSDKDNINSSVLKQKLFNYTDDKYEYPMDYIKDKIK